MAASASPFENDSQEKLKIIIIITTTTTAAAANTYLALTMCQA